MEQNHFVRWLVPIQGILRLNCDHCSLSPLVVEEKVFAVHLACDERIECPDSGVLEDPGELCCLELLTNSKCLV